MQFKTFYMVKGLSKTPDIIFIKKLLFKIHNKYSYKRSVEEWSYSIAGEDNS
jgi:hypothetical protein